MPGQTALVHQACSCYHLRAFVTLQGKLERSMDAGHHEAAASGGRHVRAVRPATGSSRTPEPATLALRIARNRGLLDGPKTKHFNAKVPPRLFDAAAKRLGTSSPAVVIQAALAALATQDDLGPWLARNMGVLADLDPALLAQLDI